MYLLSPQLLNKLKHAAYLSLFSLFTASLISMHYARKLIRGCSYGGYLLLSPSYISDPVSFERIGFRHYRHKLRVEISAFPNVALQGLYARSMTKCTPTSPFSSRLCLLEIIASFVTAKGAHIPEASSPEKCILQVPRQLT